MGTQHKNNNLFEIKFENAIRLLCRNMPAAESLIKPTLFHDIRVGVYLYNHGYSEPICIAGLLHDILEDTTVKPELLERHYGKEIIGIVNANTKMQNIPKDQQGMDMIDRCIKFGEPALIVKAADILDNIVYFKKVGPEEAIKFTETKAEKVLKRKPKTFNDNIFSEMRSILKKTRL